MKSQMNETWSCYEPPPPTKAASTNMTTVRMTTETSNSSETANATVQRGRASRTRVSNQSTGSTISISSNTTTIKTPKQLGH